MVKKIRGFDNYYISDKGEVISDKFHPTRNKFSRLLKIRIF